MPAKYSHVKKRSTGPSKKSNNSKHGRHIASNDHRNPNPHLDRHLDKSLNQAMTAVSQLERAISRLLLIRFEQDVARLFSTHLYCISLLHLPTFVMRCVSVGGPGWLAANADSEEIKNFFRSAIAMDLRQAGERVATKSVLWSYTALRHFAMSNGVPICRKRGLHSLRLLPHYPALKAHLDILETKGTSTFSKPPHLGPLTEGARALEDACNIKYGQGGNEDSAWREKVRVGYERTTQTLWRVAREFDVRGYGWVLRDKLTSKWCDCGCSTDHLSEVCEKTVAEDEEESGVRPGKEREWDGRGSGIYGWETDEEEDIWEMDLDFVSLEPDEVEDEMDMTIGELMEWRYLCAERDKEQGNVAFKKGDFERAIDHYKAAFNGEPEMPHYQLNIAAAYLKLNKYEEAERACNAALGQHRSSKGYWRRAQARKSLGRIDEAIKDLRAVLKLQPTNEEAQTELTALIPPPSSPQSIASSSRSLSQASPSSVYQPASSASASSSSSIQHILSSSTHPKDSKQKVHRSLLFPLTAADERKLKIMSLPLTVDVPVEIDAFMASMRERGKKLSESTPTRPETFSYPNWERYVVKKVS